MSRITEKKQLLERIKSLQQEIQKAKVARRPLVLQGCIQNLQEIQEICQQNLSAKQYLQYKKNFLGIIMALQHVSELGLWDEASEICDLSTKLLGISANELSNEPGIEKLRRQKKEIVFLPYKASMWDSLESIWRAAAADQAQCNTYVVPIPYAERDNDGTVRQWHNEMDQFPSDVPVMDYRIFDLDRLHPDVIYIHNPYDGENFVTSLDAAYYSENLKKYTELLIYVPYYATSGAMGKRSLCVQLIGMLITLLFRRIVYDAFLIPRCQQRSCYHLAHLNLTESCKCAGSRQNLLLYGRKKCRAGRYIFIIQV